MADRSTLGVRYVDSVETTHFTGALAQNAMELESLNFPSDWGTIGVSLRVITN